MIGCRTWWAMFPFWIWFAASPARADDVDITLPGEPNRATLRVEVTLDGRPAAEVWGEFLDRWFDYFDRTDDGTLTADEAARVVPLPRSAGSVAMNFKALDADRNGRADREEFRRFYRRAGFAPVVIRYESASAAEVAASEILFRLIDRDSDGDLSNAELRRTHDLLRRFDLNDDQRLSLTELAPPETLKDADHGAPTTPTTATRAAEQSKEIPLQKLHIALAAAPAKQKLAWDIVAGSPPLDLTDLLIDLDGDLTSPPDKEFSHFLTVVPAVDDKRPAFSAYRDFVTASFAGDFGGDEAPTKSRLAEDPALAPLVGLFADADRNADGRLAQTELRRFLELVGQGLACQTQIVIYDGGRSFWESLDHDRDRSLDVAELLLATVTRAGKRDDVRFARADIKRRYRLHAERGIAGNTFGPITLPKTPKPATAGRPKAAAGPKWFAAMDRNGDGLIAPQEFLGTPANFATLDRNGDGVVSTAEAEPRK